MHPPLERPHPMCGHTVEALVKCHSENPLAKYIGKCNDQKAALDLCFRLEKEQKRKANFKDSQRSRDLLRKMRDERAAAEATQQ